MDNATNSLLRREEKRKQSRKASKRYAEKMRVQHKEFDVWSSMKSRCHCKTATNYDNYGGKGIRVCNRWREHGKGFKNFLADMGPRPTMNHQLDRIDVNGDYCPQNCRWIEAEENNSRAHQWVGRSSNGERQ